MVKSLMNSIFEIYEAAEKLCYSVTFLSALPFLKKIISILKMSRFHRFFQKFQIFPYWCTMTIFILLWTKDNKGGKEPSEFAEKKIQTP